VNRNYLLLPYLIILIVSYSLLSILSEIRYFLVTFYLVVIFWIVFTIAIFQFSLRDAIKIIFKSKKRKIAILIFIVYISIHYFVYSIALEDLLIFLFPTNFGFTTFQATITFSPFTYPNVITAFLSLIYNPLITVIIPPYFTVVLSLYSIAFGLIIAVLVSSNLTKALEIFGLGKSFKYLAIIPLFGVISGAACCISIPYLIAFFIPAIGLVLLSSPLGSWTLLALYVLLPPVTAIALRINLNTLNKINYPKLFIK